MFPVEKNIVAPIGQTFIPNGGANITRPANTTAYTAGDLIVADDQGDLVFPNVMDDPYILGGYVVRGLVSTNQVGCTARLRLWLCTVLSASLANGAPTDNAAMNLAHADLTQTTQTDTIAGILTPIAPVPAKVLGYIDFPALAPVGAGAAGALFTGQFHFRCAVVAGYAPFLVGLLQTRDAFTPDSEQQFAISLGIERG